MNTTLVSWAALVGAIACEISGTTFLQKSEHMTKLGPTGAALAFYGLSFYLLSQALRHIPLGIAYAIWGGVGIFLTAIIGIVIFKQNLDTMGFVGIGFIIAGVVIINAFSKSVGH